MFIFTKAPQSSVRMRPNQHNHTLSKDKTMLWLTQVLSLPKFSQPYLNSHRLKIRKIINHFVPKMYQAATLLFS